MNPGKDCRSSYFQVWKCIFENLYAFKRVNCKSRMENVLFDILNSDEAYVAETCVVMCDK